MESVQQKSPTTNNNTRWWLKLNRLMPKRLQQKQSPNDPLLDRIRAIKARTNKLDYNRQEQQAHSAYGRMGQEITSFGVFVHHMVELTRYTHEYVLYPVYSRLVKLAANLMRMYIRLWNKIVLVNDGYGSKRLSKTRAFSMLMVTVICFLLLPFFGDSLLYLATVKHETVFLSNSQEIMPENNTHSVQGCIDLPCTENESVYFRVRPTLFNEVWSLWHKHTWFFPDYVAAAVPPVVSRCDIVVYGMRVKLFVRVLNVYPDIIDVKCQPLVGQQ